MTVDELMKELQKLSNQGHGDVPTLYKGHRIERVIKWENICSTEN